MHLIKTLLCVTLAWPATALPADLDSDGDGLSDFQERHKYGTDPARADSDGDGMPDGDWDERREYAYTLRTVVQLLQPVTEDVLCEDYQDARVLDRTADYVELEVIHYPLNTVAEGIAADADWREHRSAVARWLAPGVTSNWDEGLAGALRAALATEGIDVDKLDDRRLAEQASRWLCRHARVHSGFTAYMVDFDEDGQPRVDAALEATVARGIDGQFATREDQWQRELFAQGMFEHGRRGSCTSSSIYLAGCLRALGLPTRIILTVPVVDASDPREVESLARIRHPGVRRGVQAAIAKLSNSWSSHTFNEVWIGGRWVRLNFDRLGQNTLDPQLFGLLTHVATVHDWSDGAFAATYGRRQATRPPDVFGGNNPYHSIALSDRFGVHSGLDPAALAAGPGAFDRRVITRALWSDDDASPILGLQRDGRGPVLLLDVGTFDDFQVIKEFTAACDRTFFLEAEGHPTIKLDCGVGGCSTRGHAFAILRFGADAWRLHEPGVRYTLRARNECETHVWEVQPSCSVARADEPSQ